MLKAKSLQDEKCQRDEGDKILSYSHGWLEKFMNRNGLSLRRRTTEAQKTPDQLIDKLCAYILKIRRLRTHFNYDLRNIIIIDETAIWNDMMSETTVKKLGAHTVHLKTTGHKKSKIYSLFNCCSRWYQKEALFRVQRRKTRGKEPERRI